MRNRFGGYCYKCGLWVEAGTGYFERHAGGWRVQHNYNSGAPSISGKGGVTCKDAKNLAEKSAQKTT